jgi:hypothetical protein
MDGSGKKREEIETIDKEDGSGMKHVALGLLGEPAVSHQALLRIVVGRADPLEFAARLEQEAAPRTCAAFTRLLPFRNKLVQARWSGEAAWIPLGDLDLGLDFENHTSHPAPGEVLLYRGGYSETEILLAYGDALFSSKLGQLAGNHFLTITEGREQLQELGRRVLWEGAQDILFETRR